MSRQDAIDQLNAADAEVTRATVAMGEAAKAWAAQQQAADAAWLDFLRSQNNVAEARIGQQRARLMLIKSPDVPAVNPMGSNVQA